MKIYFKIMIIKKCIECPFCVREKGEKWNYWYCNNIEKSVNVNIIDEKCELYDIGDIDRIQNDFNEKIILYNKINKEGG